MNRLHEFISALRSAAENEETLPTLHEAVKALFDAYKETRFLEFDHENYHTIMLQTTRFISTNQEDWGDEMRLNAMLGAIMMNSWNDHACKSQKLLGTAQNRLQHVLSTLEETPELYDVCPLTNKQLDTVWNSVQDKLTLVCLK